MVQLNYLSIFLLLIWSCEFMTKVAVAEEIPAEVNNVHLPTDLADELPTVLIVLLVRNKAHILPYFLTYLERQNYPKSRLSLW